MLHSQIKLHRESRAEAKEKPDAVVLELVLIACAYEDKAAKLNLQTRSVASIATVTTKEFFKKAFAQHTLLYL